jgi:flagellar protein FlaJ
MSNGGFTGIQRRFHKFIIGDSDKFRLLRADLVAANTGMTLHRYIMRSVIFATIVGAACAVAGFLAVYFFLPPALVLNIYNPFGEQLGRILESPEALMMAIRILVIPVAFLLGFSLCYLFFMKFPGINKSARSTKINLLLHYAVSYMYAMRQGGAHMMDIFRSIAENAGIYGEVAVEFRKLVRDADYFGYDMITSIRNLVDTTPSEKFKDFLQDLLSVVESGGDVQSFLATRVRMYQEDARFEQQQFLNTMQLVAEAYVTVFVAGPLFIMIIMVVMGFMGSAPLIQLSLVIYILIPIGSLVFILFIDLISIKTEEIEKYVGKKWLREFDDVRRYHQEGEEPLFAQLDRYDRVRNMKNFIRNPFQAFMTSPKMTLYFTVPLAILYVAVTLMNVDPTLDFETYIAVIDDHVIIAVLIILLPFGLFYEQWRRKVMGIEAGIPEFLNRLSSINRVGLTLAQAISIMTRANLGVLSYEIRRIKRDIEWGANVMDALLRFETRVRTPTISRTVTLISKASEMSGDIGEVLTIAGKDAQMAETLKRERTTEMFIYVVIVYIVFFVFLFVVLVIDSQFLKVIVDIQAKNAASGAGNIPANLSISNLQVATFHRLFYHICLVQGFFSGLIAGAMGEGSFRAGLKHSAVMIIITIVVFAFFV